MPPWPFQEKMKEKMKGPPCAPCAPRPPRRVNTRKCRFGAHFSARAYAHGYAHICAHSNRAVGAKGRNAAKPRQYWDLTRFFRSKRSGGAVGAVGAGIPRRLAIVKTDRSRSGTPGNL